MKKFLLFLFALTAAALLASCARGGDNSASGELEYSLNQAGDAYTVVGVGDYTGLDLVIPETYQGLPVTAIDSNAFCARGDLTSVTIPASVTEIGYEAFMLCEGLTRITVSEGNPVYHSSGNCLIQTKEKMLISGCKTSVIPDDGSVTKIDARAFYGNSELTGITIPGSVREIDYSAFEGCSGLTSLTFLPGVTKINDSAFRSCEGLTSLTIPSNVTEIGSGAFMGCFKLTSITVADGNPVYHSSGNCLIQTQEKALVFGCKASVIPDDGSVTVIGNGAFENCYELTSLTIPDCVTRIGDSAFHECGNLTSITIPDSVTEIGYGAFKSCDKLTSITIPEGVTEIGERAFYQCNLTSITLPASMRDIGFQALSSNANLSSITVADGNPRYHSAGNCLIYTEGKELVFGCNTSVIPNDGSVTKIDIGAFDDCEGLTSITIPVSVTEIGPLAFSCPSLTDIYYDGTEAQWAEVIINDAAIPDTVTIHYGGEE